MRVRWSLASLSAVFSVVGSLLPAVADAGAPAAAGPGLVGVSASAGLREDPSAAVASAAVASGERVEDVSQRDAYSRVFANPDGTWTAEVTSSPARVRGADGDWHAIDTTLVGRDGGLAATHAVADVVFSDGGDRTFAALTEDGQTVEWRWPSVLPEPVVEGGTATYAGVVPGGDLVVTATATGFRHDIVLRRAPEGPVEFTMPVVTGEAALSETTDGGLEVETAAGEMVAWAPAPVMWDAETDAAGGPAEVAEVETRVGETESGMPTLTLAPDAGFLTDPDTEYPVTIDPTYSTGAAHDGWIWNADVTDPAHPADEELKVGTNDSGATKHQAYLNFDAVTAASSPVAGKEILDAEFRLRNFFSASCAGAEIRVRRITSSWHLLAGHPDSLRWNNQPSVGPDFASYNTAHGGPNCTTGTARWDVGFVVRNWVQRGLVNEGLRVTAADATRNASWRRYRSDNYTANPTRQPKLVVTYNNQPTTPTNLGLVGPCPNDDCTGGVSTSATPTLTATSTDPDAADQLTYTFQVAPAGSTVPVVTGSVGPAAQGVPVEWAVPAGKLALNARYRFRVKANDRVGGSAAGFNGSAYSGWVSFRVDPEEPPSTPTNLTVEPCISCGGPDGWATPSLTPRLSATVADPDSDSLDAVFEVRPVGGATFPQGGGSGTVQVSSGQTARFTIPAGVLAPAGSYEFRVGADDGTTTTWTGWVGFVHDPDEAPAAPAGLTVDPCISCGEVEGWVTSSLTPRLSATVDDPDSASLDAVFEVRPVGGATFPQGAGSGTVPVTVSETAEFTIPAGVLAAGGSYEFRVGADDGTTTTRTGWVGFDIDVAPKIPAGVTVDPCTTCDGPGAWVTSSLNPELAATVDDADTESLDVTFEVRPLNADGSAGTVYPYGEGSGTDLVTRGETARFTIPPDVLAAASDYEFRVGASDGASTTWTADVGEPWFRLRTAADAAGGVRPVLAEPLVVWDHGPELSWSPYRDPSGATEDDLVEYQIFRACASTLTEQQDEDCNGQMVTTYSQGPESGSHDGLVLAGTAAADLTAWRDESALASTATQAASYRYWVVARTADDVAHNRNGAAATASDPWTVTTPREGRVRRILTGDATTPDATLASGQPTQTHPNILQVGGAHTDGATDYGRQHAVIDFDLSTIPDKRTVIDADIQLYQSGGGPASATSPVQWDLHPLQQTFEEDEATWINRATGSEWTTPGGTISTPAVANTSAAGAGTPKRLTFSATSLNTAVQGWVNDKTGYHGVLVKAANESTASQWLDLATSESTAADSGGVGLAPRLVVEHVIRGGEQTIEAPDVPQRLLPGTTTTIPVTVTNTSNTTWPADMQLGYRWTAPRQTTDLATATDDKFVPLDGALAPGESKQVEVRLRAPINADSGDSDWDLYFDLYSNGQWWAQDLHHTYTDHVLTEAQRAQGVCTMVGIGLLCPNREVHSTGSTELGLEQSAAFAGEETGAGSQVLTNLHNGNLVWSYDAFAYPSVGPSMFLRVAYSSQDATNAGAGFGWSVQPGTLTRLGERIRTQSNDTVVTLVDGDGTTHTWRTEDDAFRTPPGVHLKLTSQGTKDNGSWIFTRPDGTQFFFLRSSDQQIDGRPTSVVDINGNTLTYEYGAPTSSDPNRLKRIIDAKGRQVATLGYTSTGKLLYVRHISGRTLRFGYDPATPDLLKTIEDGNADPDGTFTTPAAELKDFEFAYTTTSASANNRLSQVTDPNEATTLVEYWDTTETFEGTAVESMVDGWVESVTDRRGQTTTIDYRDGDGSEGRVVNATVVDEVDPGQPAQRTGYVLDSFGRAVEITDANDHTTRLGWDGQHNVVQLTEPNGATSRWQYDRATGYPLKVWDAEAVADGTAATELTYCEPGSGTGGCPGGVATVLDSITTPLGRTTSFDYDTDGNLIKVTDPLQQSTVYTYNTDGTLNTVEDAEHHITSYGYATTNGSAQVGYPTLITPPTTNDADNAPIAPTQFVYDDRGNVTRTEQTGNGQTLVTTVVYDDYGRPEVITAPGAQDGPRITRYVYDPHDNLLTSTAPNDAVTTSIYTADDLLDTQTLPANGTGVDRVVSYDYYLTGLLKTATSPLGNLPGADPADYTTSYGYDPVGQMLETTRHDDTGTAVTTSFGYDDAGNQISVVDPRGNRAAQLGYDLNHRQTSSIDALGYAVRTRYDRDGQVTTKVDQRGHPTRYTYTPTGLLKSVTVDHTPIGSLDGDHTRTTAFDYDAVGNRTRVTRPSGLFERVQYDANNRPIRQYSAFDPNHPVTAYQTAAVTHLKYDPLGRLAQQSNPARDPQAPQDWTTFDYYNSGDINSSTDPWGIQTRYEYNKLGQQTKRTLLPESGAQADPRTMTWGYHPDGSLAARDDTAGPAVARVIGHTEATVDGAWTTINPGGGQNGYLAHAPAAEGSDEEGDTATWRADVAQTGKYRIQMSCPASANENPDVGPLTTSAGYTVATGGQTTSATLNQRADCPTQTWHTLTELGVSGGDDVTVTVGTSTDGAVVADAVRLVKLDTRREFTYGYDADGNQTRIDDNTPPIDATHPGARVTSYTTGYDTLGRPETVTEWAGDIKARETSYGYDLNGNPTSVTAARIADGGDGDRGNLAASQTTSYDWDVRNMVVGLTATTGAAGDQTRRWAYSYDPAGMLDTLTKPDAGAGSGNTTQYSYYEDGGLRTKVERTPAPDNALVASHHLWYTLDGDRRKDLAKLDDATDAAPDGQRLDQTLSYTYTPARQLAAVTKSGRDTGKDEAYRYDAAGNVTEQTIGGVTTSNDYDRNRLICSRVGGQPDCALGGQPDQRYYAYDDFGRLAGLTGGGGSVSYSYDGFDRLIRQVTQDDSGTTTQDTGYDPLDRVTLQITDVSGETTRTRFGYLGLTEQVATEEQHDTTGWQVTKAYAHGPDGQPVSLVSTPLNGETKTRYYSTNPHGDTEALTDPATGQTTATYRYTAYGDTDPTGTTGEDEVSGDPEQDADILNPYRYSGHRFNGATDTYDFGFRNYDPGLNRFLTRDMYNGALSDMRLGLDPWNTNRYMLAGGNPITGIDLDGHAIPHDDGTSGTLTQADRRAQEQLAAEYAATQAAVEDAMAALSSLDGDDGSWHDFISDPIQDAGDRIGEELGCAMYQNCGIVADTGEGVGTITGDYCYSGHDCFEKGKQAWQVVGDTTGASDVITCLITPAALPCAAAATILVPGGPGARTATKSVDEVAQAGDTVLYQKLSSTGEHLKYGITKNPATRYTSKELDGGSLNILARGSKQDMLALERSLHETLPIGPEERQLFYIQKQIANGLRSPPYPW